MSVKTVALATVFVFGAGLLALYAAWQLDESKKLVRTNVVEQSEEDESSPFLVETLHGS